MATYTGNLSTPGTSATIQIRLIVNQTSQNIANNTSTVSWSLALVKTSSGGYPYSNMSKGSASASVNGSVLSKTGINYNFSGGSGQTLLLGSGSKVIAHNANGTKSISVAGAYNAGGEEIGNGSCSGTLTLTTIPRATTPTVTPANGETGSSFTINHSPATSSFYHDVAYSLDGGATYTNIATNVPGTTTSTPWTPAHSLLPNDDTKTATIRVITRSSSGGTVIGTKTVNTVLSVPESIKPTVLSVAWADGQTSAPNMPSLMGGAGRYVRRWSKLKPTITANPGIGAASVIESSVNMSGQVTESGVAFDDPINSSGNVSFAATAVDTRDRTSDPYYNTVAVKAYDYPSLPTPTVTRTSDAAGTTPDPTGTYLRITPNASVSKLDFSGEKNLLEWQIRTRPKGGSWTTKQAWTTATVVGNTVWTTPKVLAGYSASSEFEVEVSIRDLFGKNGFSTANTVQTRTLNVPSEAVFMDWNESTGIGLGRYHSGTGARLQVANGIEVSTGNLAVSTGNVTVSTGNISAPNAVATVKDVNASGDVSGNTGTIDDLDVSTLHIAGVRNGGYIYADTIYYTASGTFNKADYPLARAIRVRVQAGGGSGGGASSGSSGNAFGQGGGGGGYSESFITDLGSLPASVTVTVGAGGVTATGAYPGNSGGASSFGDYLSATGGGGGGTKPKNAYTAYVSTGSGGVGQDGDLNLGGGGGGTGTGMDSLCTGGSGGSSYLGGGGWAPSSGASGSSSTGQPGRGYGGGGGGAMSNQQGAGRAGGSGADGIVIVEIYN